MKKTTVAIVFLFVLIFAIPIAGYLTINVPANVRYQNLFGSHVTLAVEGNPDFSGIKSEVDTVYANMNATFPDRSLWATTYNNPWPWGRTYDNSLQAEAVYLHHIDLRITFYEQLVNKSGQNQLSDVYNQAIVNLRNEMKSSGGLDWAISGAWYLQYAPLAYWDITYFLIIDIVLFGICVLLAMKFGL